MAAESFHRARRQVGWSTPEFAICAGSLVAALVLAALLLLLGLITHLLARADAYGSSEGSLTALLSRPDAAPQDAAATGRHPPGWRGAQALAAALAGQPSTKSPGIGLEHRLLLLLLVAGLALSAFYCVVQLGLDRAIQAAAARVTLALRGDLYNQHLRLGGVDLGSRRQAGIEELLDERVESVREGVVQWWRGAPYAAVAIPVLVLVALKAQLWVAVVAILLIALNWLLLERWEQSMRRHRALWSDRQAQQTAALGEALRHVRLAHAAAVAELPGEAVPSQLARLEQAAQGREAGQSAWTNLQIFFIAATVAMLLALAGANVLRTPPKTTVAETVLLTAALLCLADPAQRLLRLRASTARADRAARAIFTYLDRRPLVVEADAPIQLKPLARELDLEAITLDDPSGARLLDNVSLRIAPRSRIAVVSTQPRTLWGLVGLLCRWFDPTAGHVRIDGVDLKNVSLESLRRQVQPLLQDALLFPGNVADNVSCGDARFGEAEIVQALRRVQAISWVQQLPAGLATMMGDHANRLDPGAAWQLGLARLVIRDASLAVVEEPAEPLSPTESQQLDGALLQLAKDRTVIVLATRLSTLRTADRVLLFHEGRLHAQGAHAALLQSSDLYRHLNYVRFNDFRQFSG